MKMASRIRFGLALLSLPAVASAQVNIPVVNHSFESPPVDTTFLPVSLAVTGWSTAGPSADIDVDLAGPEPARNSGTGIFPNPAPGPTRFTNADENQLAYIFTTTGEEFFQTLSSSFQSTPSENVYQLTVAVGNATAAPGPADQLLLQLFYTDPGEDPADPANRSFVATRSVTSLGDGLSSTALKDLSAISAPITAGSPALGRPINVLITTVGVGGTQFDFDNVRVSAIPEPAGAALAAAGALVATMRRRRHALL